MSRQKKGVSGSPGPAGSQSGSGPAQWLIQEGGGTIQAAFATVTVTQGLPDMVTATQPRSGMRRFKCVPTGAGANQVGTLGVQGVISGYQGGKVSGRIGVTMGGPTSYAFAGIGWLSNPSHNPVTAPLLEQGIALVGTGNWYFVSAGATPLAEDLGAAFAYDVNALLDYDIEWGENQGTQAYRVQNRWTGADTGWRVVPDASKLVLTPGAVYPSTGAYRDAVVWASRGPAGAAAQIDGVHLRGQQGRR